MLNSISKGLGALTGFVAETVADATGATYDAVVNSPQTIADTVTELSDAFVEGYDNGLSVTPAEPTEPSNDTEAAQAAS